MNQVAEMGSCGIVELKAQGGMVLLLMMATC